ncbi:nitroreductase [Papillibacter cinnamivorans]|uniref:Nitroreductase n=1 Tax=Papillibacter cinnamivorans DSM 12816 TaxID=1122930 RepID=A0A1W1ZFE7_9FIRM|nr:nitroreductase [Papillibacter cinnamivorans]SMC47210.1 Nitroreductase [Papillibacter cinnamivorans DSM 12816]
METKDAILSRKSIRGYLAKPVPREVVRQILETALRAPSAENMQPWHIAAVTGAPLEGIRRDNVENVLSGAPAAKHPELPEAYQRRRVELAIELFGLMDIQREDKAKRKEWLLRGFRFFDAPVAIILSVSKSLRGETWPIHDIGALSQTICLAAEDLGLGTCIEAQGVLYTDVIRKHTGLPEDREPVIGIALGYPDPAFPANRLKSRRAEVDEVTVWAGF